MAIISCLDGTLSAIVGGGSGIGFATAKAIVSLGGDVVLLGRSRERLDQAADALASHDNVRIEPMDMTSSENVSRVFQSMPSGSLNHLIVTASSAVHGPFPELAIDKVESMFASKFFGPYRTVQTALPALADGASVTLFSGVLSRRPGINCAALGAVNGAVESLTYGLALELGPRVRVNCIAPGMVRTEAYASISEDAREQMYRSTGESLPIGRVGNADELATAVLFAMTCTYLTGQVIDVDGGHTIRQYATR